MVLDKTMAETVSDSLFIGFDPTGGEHAACTRIENASVGKTASGCPKIRLEMSPAELARLVGYDPRSLEKRSTKGADQKNLDPVIVHLHQDVQRSIDQRKVDQMVAYLRAGLEAGEFADWDEISLVTVSLPDLRSYKSEHLVFMPSKANYFICDGQHRFCALLDLLRCEDGTLAMKFTQSVAISVLPHESFTEWAGQAFHDKNYLRDPVKAAKALAVDNRDEHNRLAKEMHRHEAVVRWGGINTSMSSVRADGPEFATHSTWYKFCRAFLEGMRALETKGDLSNPHVNEDNFAECQHNLREFITILDEIFPHMNATVENRGEYLFRNSSSLQALGVFGNQVYTNVSDPVRRRAIIEKIGEKHLDWRRTNVADWGNVIGTAEGGVVKPATNRSSLRAVLKLLKERSGLSSEVLAA